MLPLILCIVFICLGAISLTLFLLEKTKRYSLKAVFLKTTTSLFFIATAAVSLILKGYHYLAVFVPFGLFLGLLGDIWLDLKYVYREHDVPYTYAGFISFGLGHIVYMSGLFLEFYHGESVLYIIIPFAVGLLLSFGNLFMEKPMKLKYGQMKPIAFVYGFILFSMTLSALSLSILHAFTNTTLIMFFIGGLLFAISDLILSGTYFGEGKERPIDITTNGITYYAAQFIIAFSLFFL